MILLTVAIALPLGVYFLTPSRAVPRSYIGSVRCGSCHGALVGEPYYERWKESPHAKAYKSLQTGQTRDYLATHSDSLVRCLGCHSPLGRTARTAAEEELNQEGVSCESCHGAGSEYANFRTMRDSAAFRMEGGVHGSLRNCTGCHRSEPRHRECPFDGGGFEANAGWKALGHPHKTLQGQQ